MGVHRRVAERFVPDVLSRLAAGGVGNSNAPKPATPSAPKPPNSNNGVRQEVTAAAK